MNSEAVLHIVGLGLSWVLSIIRKIQKTLSLVLKVINKTNNDTALQHHLVVHTPTGSNFNEGSQGLLSVWVCKLIPAATSFYDQHNESSDFTKQTRFAYCTKSRYYTVY